MQLIDFIDACNIGTKNDTDVFVLFCYYLMKENGSVSFSAKKMLHMYGDIGLAAPDAAVLKKDAALCGSFRPFGIEGTLRFTKDAMRSLEKSYGHLWTGVAAPKAAAVSASVTVRIADFVDAHGMTSRTDTENLELLCYYVTKEKRGKPFHIRSVLDMYDNAELDVSDRAALEKYAKKHPSFRTTGLDGSMEFVPTAFARLDALHGKMWMDADERPKGSTPDGCEIIDMNRFGGKRDGFDKLIAQINSSYRNEEFDSCALVMRRLLEAALISSFRAAGADGDIKSDGRYIELADLVRKAVGTDAMADIANDLIAVSVIGDYSGKGEMYTFGANDINSVRIAYRNVLDALI